MTAPKTYKRYASQWFELFNALRDEPNKIHVIHCPTEKAARALRLEFYKAREAFVRDPDLKAEFEMSLNGREVKIVNGTQVVFDLKDNNWIGKLLTESLHKEDEQ